MDKQPEHEIAPSILQQLNCDHPTDIFSSDVEKLMREALYSEDKLVTHKEIGLYLFKESQLQTQIAKAHGGKACRYEGADHDAIDGAMWQTLKMMEKMRDNYYNNKGKEIGDESDFRWQGSMAADSFTIKDKIVYGMNSLQM
eukprot:737970-Ditylum_brightwellii.AAC.1